MSRFELNENDTNLHVVCQSGNCGMSIPRENWEHELYKLYMGTCTSNPKTACIAQPDKGLHTRDISARPDHSSWTGPEEYGHVWQPPLQCPMREDQRVAFNEGNGFLDIRGYNASTHEIRFCRCRAKRLTQRCPVLLRPGADDSAPCLAPFRVLRVIFARKVKLQQVAATPPGNKKK